MMHRSLSCISLLMFFLLLATTEPRARAASSSAFIPPFSLTSAEQSKRLLSLNSPPPKRQLFHGIGEGVSSKPYYQRDYRTEWSSASSPERVRIAERIGNQGRARFAAERGWIKLLGSQKRGIAQGPDSIYWDKKSGRIRVLEAKGGSSQLKWTYNSWQGTNKNTIRSAEFTLKSTKTSLIEKAKAARSIRAAQQNRLWTGVANTPHNRGKPGGTRLKGQGDTTNVSKEAFGIERRLIKKNTELTGIFKKAGRAQSMDMFKFRGAQGLAALGIAGSITGSAMLGLEAYHESQEAWNFLNDPALQHTALPWLYSLKAIGRGAEAVTLGLDSTAALGLKLGGQAAGKWFLPIAIGVETISAGTAYYEYSTGRISKREFYKRSTGPAIFTTFTAAGAGIGACFGGVGAIPGAAIGATVAIPFQYVASRGWKQDDMKRSEAQQKAIDKAVERLYQNHN